MDIVKHNIQKDGYQMGRYILPLSRHLIEHFGKANRRSGKVWDPKFRD